MFAEADGYDDHGRWHQDSSGLVHPYDSPEAVTVAATENWLHRFGFLDAKANTFWGRPVDVLQQPDGSLLVSDEQNGAIYRVSYGSKR